MNRKAFSVLYCAAAVLCAAFVLLGCASGGISRPVAPAGYVLSESRPIPMIQGTAYVYNHIKSGARVVYVQNSDTNLSFNIALSTPPVASKGLNHILEHVVLASSKAYPGKEVFFGAANTTLNTYINAFTAATYTMFPLSSTNEKQFMQLADYYLSSVFEPTLDENTFKREGWRYELADAASPLAINGIVYSEMQGANANILRAAGNLSREQLFPDTVVKNDSGGSTQNIPQLTLEELRAYHAEYFVPSNSIIGVYGDLDIEEFLTFLDSQWLSRYAKKDVPSEIPPQKPFDQPRYARADFPVSAGSPAQKKSVVSKSYAVSGLDARDFPAFFLYISILNDPASPLMDSLRRSNLADSYFISLNPATRQMQFDVIAQNIDESDAQKFEQLVLAALNDSAVNGFEKQLFDSQKAVFYADGLLARENTGIGIDLLTDMAAGDIIFDSRYAFATVNYDVQNVTLKDVMRVARIFFAENSHTVLATVTPKPGLAEELEKRETERLASLKASMTPRQIESLVSETKAFNEWLNSPDTEGAASLRKLQVLRPENLQNALVPYRITDTQKDGFRYLYTEVPGSVSKTLVQINLSHLTRQELLYAKLYASLLGSLDAAGFTYREAGNRLKLLTLGASFSVEPAFDTYLREASYPVFSISWLNEKKNASAAERLVSDIVFDTRFNEDRIREQLASFKAGAERLLQSGAASLAINRSGAAAFYPYALGEFLGGIPYIEFIRQTFEEFAQNPTAVIESLRAVREKMLVNGDVLVCVAGETDKKPAILTGRLVPQTQKPGRDYQGLPVPAGREAVIINDTVNYTATAQVVPYEKRMQYAIAADVLSNGFLTPKIRLEGGAYGGNAGVNRRVFFSYSLRDPNLDRTIGVFNDMKLFASSINANLLEPYIISRYGSETSPIGVYSLATANMLNHARGYTAEMRYADIESLKGITAPQIARIVETLETGSRYTVFASDAALKKSGLLFDSIIDTTK